VRTPAFDFLVLGSGPAGERAAIQAAKLGQRRHRRDARDRRRQTATQQGRLAVAHACGLPTRQEGTFTPYGVYAIPELSMVGDTEEQLTAARVGYEIRYAYDRESARGERSRASGSAC
jgi:pyruvate/2-oxoglutarate dehydrogenase complex dihydrolipoamide dehydrogenase (E3) component